jgi:hypothetical protein
MIMMREILYRGKIEGNGVWTFGAYYHQTEFYGEQCDYHLIISSCDELEDNMMWRDNVDPETIGQYIGITDKNGTKIFEGDIVKLYLVDGILVGLIGYSEEDFRFKFYDDGIYDYGFDDTNVFKVIGNIYDNPELLGGVKNG